MQQGKIYIVKTPKGLRVIEGISKNAVIRFAASTEISAELVKGREAIDLISAGAKLETCMESQMDLFEGGGSGVEGLVAGIESSKPVHDHKEQGFYPGTHPNESL